MERKFKNVRRGVYILPNLLTTGALFAGFYAIVAAMNADFELAAMAIFVAMVMDTLDGRVARLTNTQTKFGAEYDSLSDIVNFGLAPSLVVYQWGLDNLGKIGWLIAFFYTAATALRLARFNSQMGQKLDKRFFVGMPCPAAAGVVAGMIWVFTLYEVSTPILHLFASGTTIFMGLLMVSNILFHSFKDLHLRNKVPFVAVLVILLGFVFVALDPATVLFGIFFSYALSGPLLGLFRWRRRKNMLKKRREKI